jgi:transposase
MSVDVGMDVHRQRSRSPSWMRPAPQRNRDLPHDPAKLILVLGTLPPGTPVALEAAYGWGWLVELREELELEPELVQPSRCKAIAAARLKNDQVAAATLAPLLGADLLPEAWITPQPVGDLRALLRHRAALVRLSTRASIGSTSCSLTVGSPRTGSCGPVLGGRGWSASSCRRSHARSSRTAAGCWMPGHPDRPAGAPDGRAGQARPRVRRSWSCPAWVG